MCNNAAHPQPGRAVLSGSLGPRCLRPSACPSPPRRRLLSGTDRARTSPPGTGPARPAVRRTLFSDKIHPVCHVPSGPQLPLPSASLSADTGRRWQCLWPYHPRPRCRPGCSCPRVRGPGPPAGRACLGLSPPALIPDFAPLARWALTPRASGCPVGFGGSARWPPRPRGPASTLCSPPRRGGASAPPVAALPPTIQSRGVWRGSWCQPASTSAPSSGLKASSTFPAGPRVWQGLWPPPEGAGPARFTLNGAEGAPSSVKGSFFVLTVELFGSLPVGGSARSPARRPPSDRPPSPGLRGDARGAFRQPPDFRSQDDHAAKISRFMFKDR